MLGKQARCHQWAFLLGVVLISIGFAPSVHADEFFDKVCTDTVNCTSYAGARCLQTNVTGVLKCGCETSSGAKMTGNICRIDVELGQKCNGVFAFCKQANSECVHAGGMNSEYRCKCQQDYVAVKNDNGTLQCAKILTKRDNANCSQCYDNDGICYEYFDKSRRCLCPVSRAGDECERLLVKVQCARHQLDICYEAHKDVNITTASMYAHSYGRVSTCRARPSKGSDFCPVGRLQLSLDLSDKELEKCGIQRMTFDADYIRYVAMMDVSRSKDDVDPYIFKAFCEYQFRKNAQIETSVKGINQNDNGERKEPTVKFIAIGQLGEPHKSGDSVRRGDPVKLRISVALDGIYSGVQVQQCVVSTSPQIPDPKASTRLIYEKGCPAANQPYIEKNMLWGSYLGRLNEKETPYFKMFKMQGPSVYFHCSFTFCMGNDTAPCAPNKCTGDAAAPPPAAATPKPSSGNSTGSAASAAPAAPAVTTAAPAASANATAAPASNTTAPNATGKKRKKRDLATQVPVDKATLTFALKAEEPENYKSSPSTGVANKLNMSNAAFAGFLAGVIIILLLLMVVSAIILVRMRKQGGQESDKVTMTDRPQRFALPRNNHLRI